MAKIQWDATSEKIFETGIDKGVLYNYGSEGVMDDAVAWNGLTGIDENPSGAEVTKLYADNIVYASLTSGEEYGLTIKAYTYPDEFAENDGSAELIKGVKIGQQARKPFGLSYQTVIGNDTEGQGYGYKIHLVYGCTASPSAKSHATINNSPSAIEFSWSATSTPVNVNGMKPTSTLEIDSTKFVTEAEKAKLQALEDALYGTESKEAYLPTPDQVVALLS